MLEDNKITKEAINELPLVAYEGPVELVTTDAQLAAAVEELANESVLGFDTETRPSFQKGQSYPVAVLQLASAEKVYVFQLLKLENLHPLVRILANPRMIKAGVAIQDDIKKLLHAIPFKPAGFVEIATLTTQAGILNTGLRSLAGLLLNCRISKSSQVTNWAKPNLSAPQIQYAATDAWVSRNLYLKALHLPKAPTPPARVDAAVAAAN